MKKNFLVLILMNSFCWITFASDNIREHLIQRAAKEREREKIKEVEKQKHIQEKLLAYKKAKENDSRSFCERRNDHKKSELNRKNERDRKSY